MLDGDKMYALGKMMAQYTRGYVKDNLSEISNNEMLDLCKMLKTWKEGPYKVNDVVFYWKYPYRCVQAHDSTGNPSWNPIDAQSLWANYHGTDMLHALPYVQPTGAHDAYMKGEWIDYYDDCYYVALQDNLVWDPEDYPQGWKKMTERGEGN